MAIHTCHLVTEQGVGGQQKAQLTRDQRGICRKEGEWGWRQPPVQQNTFSSFNVQFSLRISYNKSNNLPLKQSKEIGT